MKPRERQIVCTQEGGTTRKESCIVREVLPDDQLKRAVHILEAIRSQMCWEADRDQLTMGMKDLLGSVTKFLEDI